MDVRVYSPIGTLHPELLSEIFVYAVSSYVNSTDSSEHESFDPRDYAYPRLISAICLSAICRTWRAVAHSTPSLWATIGLESISTKRIYPKMSLVESWVERSAFYPLDVTLEVLYDVTSDDLAIELEEEEDRFVLLVRRHRKRLRSLRILCVPTERLGGKLMEVLTQEDMPMLEVLSLRVSDGREVGYEGVEIKIPYLKRLKNLDLDLGRVAPVFPSKLYESLLTLTIDSTSHRKDSSFLDHLLEMLEGCSATLKSFEWKTVALSPPSSHWQNKQITFPSLTTLHVNTDYPPTPFFSLLTLPSLTSFYLFYPECEMPLAFHPGLLSRSRCPRSGQTKLEEILLDTNSDLPSHEILEIFKISPGLKSVFFREPLTEALVLALGETTPQVAPLLQCMRFSQFQEGEGGDIALIRLVDALEKMILLRWGGPSGLYPENGPGQLKSVRVHDFRDEVRRLVLSHPGLWACIMEGFALELI